MPIILHIDPHLYEMKIIIHDPFSQNWERTATMANLISFQPVICFHYDIRLIIAGTAAKIFVHACSLLMVLILDGNSEHVVQVLRKKGEKKFDFWSNKMPWADQITKIGPNVRTYSRLPSNVSTMSLLVNIVKGFWTKVCPVIHHGYQIIQGGRTGLGKLQKKLFFFAASLSQYQKHLDLVRPPCIIWKPRCITRGKL